MQCSNTSDISQSNCHLVAPYTRLLLLLCPGVYSSLAAAAAAAAAAAVPSDYPEACPRIIPLIDLNYHRVLGSAKEPFHTWARHWIDAWRI